MWDLPRPGTEAAVPVPCIGKRILYHWTTREVPGVGLLTVLFARWLSFISTLVATELVIVSRPFPLKELGNFFKENYVTNLYWYFLFKFRITDFNFNLLDFIFVPLFTYVKKISFLSTVTELFILWYSSFRITIILNNITISTKRSLLLKKFFKFLGFELLKTLYF